MRNPRFKIFTRVLCALALVITGSAADAQGFVVSGTLAAGGPEFQSPNFSPGTGPLQPPDMIVEERFFLSAVNFTVSVTGNYVFNSTASFTSLVDPEATGGQPALFLYAGAFDPLAPLQNVLFGATAVNFETNLLLPATLPLVAATPYVLVTTSFFAQDIGAFQTTCTPAAGNPNGACLLGTSGGGDTVVPEPSTVLLSASGLLALALFARRRRAR
jgi:hypothetical protein